MKTIAKNIRPALALIGILSAVEGANAASTPEGDQIAIQLGAIQLNLKPSDLSIATNAANALVQGQNAMALTLAKTSTQPYVLNYTNGAWPSPQTVDFRLQYYNAVQAALTNPQSVTLSKVTVKTITGTGTRATSSVSATLAPSKTTPAAILQVASAAIPNRLPGLVQTAVAASMNYTTTNGVVVPVFGTANAQPKGGLTNAATRNVYNQGQAAAQLLVATKAATTALTAACKAYPTGTANWAGFPTNGTTTNPVLPNFSTNTLGQVGAVNPDANQAPDLTGLANAAAAVSANAIAALTNNPGSVKYFGQTVANVQTMTKTLITTAATYQPVSTATVSSGTDLYSGYTYGSIGASTFGVTTQVSGSNNYYFDSTLSSSKDKAALLNGVLFGAVSAVKANQDNVNAVASGFTQGFMFTYLFTTTETIDVANGSWLSNYQTDNTSFINKALQRAYGKTTVDFTSLINGEMQSLWTDYKAYIKGNRDDITVFNNIPGAQGIINSGNFPYLNGVGTPVTDTVGL
jgi:hypothetical protein